MSSLLATGEHRSWFEGVATRGSKAPLHFVESSQMPLLPTEETLQILLVDDSADDADLLQIELAGRGLAPAVTRVDTEGALRGALEWGNWDVVISDYAMPKFDGMRAFRITHETRPELPFIFVSGALGEERAVEAMRAGARDYIVKGAHYSRVAEAIRRELDAAKAQRQSGAAEDRARREQEVRKIAMEATGAGIFEYWVQPDGETRGVVHRLLRWRGGGPVRERFGDDIERIGSWTSATLWLADHVHPDDMTRVMASANEVRRTVDRSTASARLRDQRGRWVDVQVSIEVLERGTTGGVRRLVGIVLDVTEQRALEAQLRHAQKMDAVGRLAGGVAHDFNNYLTIILGFAHVASLEFAPGSSALSDLQEISKAAKRASSLTRQLLTFARQNHGAPRAVSPAFVVRNADSLLRQTLGEGITFERNLAADAWHVHMDPVGLEQVLYNLAANARDAMPNGGTFTLEVENRTFDVPVTREEVTIRAGRFVVITARDTGEGMDARIRQRVFEPFFTTRQLGKGTGLGLSVCFGVVEHAGGYIVVDSEPGRGATFRVLLPRDERHEHPLQTATEGKILRGTERVFVVDDDKQARAFALRVLGESGYRTSGASNGSAAWELLADGASRVDLIVTSPAAQDPESAGLLARARAMAAPPRFLFMRGPDDGPRGADGTKPKPFPVLYKPFSPQALLEAVRAVLDAREPPNA